MERRNWSIEALKQLRYIDSLDDDQRAQRLVVWSEEYLVNDKIENFDLILDDLEELSELFYKNVIFLREYQNNLQSELKEHHKIKEFLS